MEFSTNVYFIFMSSSFLKIFSVLHGMTIIIRKFHLLFHDGLNSRYVANIICIWRRKVIIFCWFKSSSLLSQRTIQIYTNEESTIFGLFNDVNVLSFNTFRVMVFFIITRYRGNLNLH